MSHRAFIKPFIVVLAACMVPLRSAELTLSCKQPIDLFDYIPLNGYAAPFEKTITHVDTHQGSTQVFKMPFAYKELPRYQQHVPQDNTLHITILQENSYSITRASVAELVASGPNSPCITIVATAPDTTDVVVIHKHWSTSAQRCAQIISESFASSDKKNLFVLLYSVKVPQKIYYKKNSTHKTSWFSHHGKQTQEQDILSVADIISTKTSICAKNLTLTFVTEKKSVRQNTYHILNLLIDPARKGIDNPWGVYNTTLYDDVLDLTTEKSFSIGTLTQQSTGCSESHFYTIGRLAKKSLDSIPVHLYNSLPPALGTTDNCQLCTSCIEKGDLQNHDDMDCQ